MEDLGSDGTAVKVMAAFGALPEMIDAWVLTRAMTACPSVAPVRALALSSSDLRMRFEVCCRE